MTSHSFFRRALAVALLFKSASTADGQSVVTLRLTEAAIASGTSGSCTVLVHRAGGPGDSAEDTLHVEVTGAAPGTPGKAPATVNAFLDATLAATILQDSSKRSSGVGVRGLRDRIVRVRRVNSTDDLCAVTPVPLIRAAVLPSGTDFVADGELGAALRSGAGAATGSLGIHHKKTKKVGESFPGLIGIPLVPRQIREFLTYTMHREEFRALITVAGASNALEDSTGDAFTQAVLTPETATRGALGSVYLEYAAMQQYGNGQYRGLWVAARTVRSQWHAIPRTLPNGTRSSLNTAKDVSISTLDLRVRWMPITQLADERGNIFAVTLDFGWIWRGLDGAGARDSTFLMATLGENRQIFTGPVAAVGIQLRNITAMAELPFTRKTTIENLAGFQPVFRVRVEAPMFTISAPENR